MLQELKNQGLTTEYNIGNFLEATKIDCTLTTFYLEGYGERAGTMYLRDFSVSERLSSIRKKSHEELSEGWSRLAKM